MRKLLATFVMFCLLLGSLMIPSYAASNYYDEDLFLSKLGELENIIKTDGLINSYNEKLLEYDITFKDREDNSLIILERDGIHFLYYYGDTAKIEMTFNKDEIQYVDVEVITSDVFVFKANARIDALNFTTDEDDLYRFAYDNTKGPKTNSNHFANLLFNLAFTAWNMHLRRDAGMSISELGFANYCPGHTELVPGYIVQQPSCNQEGRQKYVCNFCGLVYEERIIPKTNHTYKTNIVPATDKEDGRTERICKVCGDTQETASIARIASVELEKTTFVCDGKKKKPAVIVKDANGRVISNKNYSIEYSGSGKKVGVYNVTVIFKGNYSGTFILPFKVMPAKATELKKSGKKMMWTEAKGAQKYIVYYSESKDGTYKKLGSTSKTVLSLKKLELGKTYYFKIRTFAKVDGKALYGAYSNILKAKLK